MEHILNFEQHSPARDSRNASRHFVQQFRIRENILKAGIMINGAEYERAIITLNEVLAEDPNNIDALNDITTAYIFNSDFIQAINTIHRVLELDPGNEDALFRLTYIKTRNECTN